eukprot:1911974-Pleurochrysis_carterae.AAC.1
MTGPSALEKQASSERKLCATMRQRGAIQPQRSVGTSSQPRRVGADLVAAVVQLKELQRVAELDAVAHAGIVGCGERTGRDGHIQHREAHVWRKTMRNAFTGISSNAEHAEGVHERF